MIKNKKRRGWQALSRRQRRSHRQNLLAGIARMSPARKNLRAKRIAADLKNKPKSEAHKAAISEALKASPKHPWRGRSLPQAVKDKMRASHLRRAARMRQADHAGTAAAA